LALSAKSFLATKSHRSGGSCQILDLQLIAKHIICMCIRYQYIWALPFSCTTTEYFTFSIARRTFYILSHSTTKQPQSACHDIKYRTICNYIYDSHICASRAKKRNKICQPIIVVQGSERHRLDKGFSRQLKGEKFSISVCTNSEYNGSFHSRQDYESLHQPCPPQRRWPVQPLNANQYG
jgi:hypothetical protein